MFSIQYRFAPKKTETFANPIFSQSTRKVSHLNLSLYLVTDRDSAKNDKEFIFKVKQAVKGGVTCVQIRDHHHHSLTSCLSTIDRIQSFLKQQNVPLIINNRIDVALAVNADGVHLGQKDFPYQKARKLLGERAVIGLTVENWDDVIAAEQLSGKCYLGVQLFQSVRTKLHSNTLWGFEGLKKIRNYSKHEVVAIGGITLENLRQVYRILNPDDGAAMVGDLWRAKNPLLVAHQASSIYKSIHYKKN